MNPKLLPLAHAQKRIWYMEQIYEGTSINNIGGIVRFQHPIEFSKLEISINNFIKNHDSMRLKLKNVENDTMQYIAPYIHIKINQVDFSTSEDPDYAFNRWANMKFREPFELTDSRLYEFEFVNFGNGDNGYFVKVHHLIADGWSMQLMTRQIVDNYRGLLDGGCKIHTPPSSSYMQYLDIEMKYLNSNRFERDKAYWVQKLQQNKSNEGVNGKYIKRSLSGNRKSFRLDDELTKRIMQFVFNHGTSVNIFLIAVLSTYLYRNYHMKEFIIGTPVYNRTGKKEKQIVGMCTSTMPVKIMLDYDLSFHDLMQLVKSEVMSGYLSQRYPYDLIIQDIGSSNKGQGSVFEYSINYYNTDLASEINGEKITNMELYSGYQLVPLQIIAKQWDNGPLTIEMDYHLDKYTNESIIHMFNDFLEIAHEMLEDLTTKVQDVMKKESVQESKKETLNNVSVHERFDEQAKKTPSNIAIIDGNIKFTYEQLRRESNALAKYLQMQGIGRGHFVPIIANHSIELIIGILGILKSGAAYVPIDPDYPIERKSYILKACNASIVLLNGKWLEGIEWNGLVLNLYEDKYWTIDNCQNPEISSNDLAYVIFTSGSTGSPKGVMVEHRGLTNYINWAENEYVQNKQEIFALFTSISFDLTITSIFTPLVGGHTIAIYRDDEQEFTLRRILKEGLATIIKATPSHLSLIQKDFHMESKVHTIIVGGEDLKTEVATRILLSFQRTVRLINEYGPTEAVVGCIFHEFNLETDKYYNSVPIGRAIPNFQVLILDKKMKPVSLGEIGELYLIGVGVARGYLNDDDLTEKSFLMNGNCLSERMYKTGDMARQLDSGLIEYLGREDHQVKINGYRIDLHEIESVLLRMPSIWGAVVVKHPDKDALCCYVSLNDNQMDELGIRKHLESYLPSYMMPSSIVMLEDIPLTSNGKIDRKRLPSSSNSKTIGVFAQDIDSNVVSQITRIYEEVLEIESFNLKDNFFNLGGDSVKAIQISSRLKGLGIMVKPKHVLTYPSVDQILSFINTEKFAVIETIEEPSVGTIMETPIIRWFFEQPLNNKNYWGQSVLLELSRSISEFEIEEALMKLIEQHDALRMHFKSELNKLYIDSATDIVFELIVQDISNLSELEQLSFIKEFSIQVKASININKGSLMKACLYKKNAEGNLLLLTAHHLIIDGVSWNILLDQLSDILNGGDISSLNKSQSFKSWANQQYRYRLNNNVKDELNYWTKVLNIERPNLFEMNNSPGEVILNQHTKIESRVLTTDLTRNLMKEAIVPYKTKVSELLVFALARTLNSVTKKTEIMLELEGHGREEITESTDITNTVGWFTTIFPINIILDPSQQYANQLKSVKEVMRSVPAKGFNFGILKYLLMEDKLNLVDRRCIRFNYLGNIFSSFASDLMKLSLEDTGPDICPTNRLSCLFEIVALIFEEQLKISVTYNIDEFESTFIQQLLEEFELQIAELVDHCIHLKSIDLTPSDFDGATLLQSDLDILFE